MLSPLLVYLLINFFKNKKDGQKKKNEFNKFKKKAIKIEFNLDAIEIISNSWTEEEVIDKSKYAGLNQLTGNYKRNIKEKNVFLNYLKIRIPYEKSILNCDKRVMMDKDELKIRLLINKSTTLYIDHLDSKKYYLDLEFLNTQ